MTPGQKFCEAVSVREAFKDAVAGFGGEGPVELASPSTGEAVFMAIQKRLAKN